MPPAAQSPLFCTADDVRGLMSALGLDGAVDDDASGSLDPDEVAPLVQQGLEYATARVKFRCQRHYSTAALESSWLANEWATCLAACWFAGRRLNPVPEPLKALCEAANGDLREVEAGLAVLPDVGKRNVDAPLWSNVTVDPRYRVKQIRVQKPVSERTPTQYPQVTDRVAEAFLEQ